MIAAALLLALAVQADPSVRLDCRLSSAENAVVTPVKITITGRHVAFEDSTNLLGDEHATVPANQRGWAVKTETFAGGPGGRIRLRSRVTIPGHAAQIQMTRSGEGPYTGRYFVNQGMLSETVAQGASGDISCEVLS